MANDTIRIEFTTVGGAAATTALKNFEAALQRTAEAAGKFNSAFNGIGAGASRLGQQANTAAGAIANAGRSLGGVTSNAQQAAQGFGRAGQQFTQTAQQINSATIALARSLGGNFGQAQNFAKSLGLTAAQAQAAIARINQLNSVGATTAQRYRVLKDEFGLTAVQMGKLSIAAREAAANTERLKSASANSGRALQDLAAGSRAIAAGLASGIKDAIQEFIRFDQLVRSAGVISGEAGTQGFANLREEITRLGLVTSKTPAQIAEISVQFARAGFDAQQIADSLEGVVRASEATGERLDVVGDVIAKTIRSFGLAASDSSRVADVLVATANSTNTTISGLGESLKFVAPVAAAAGQNLEDVAIVLGLVGDAGLQGGQAGRNLATALTRLQIAAGGANKELSSLNRGAGGQVRALKLLGVEATTASGRLRPITELLPDIQKSLQRFSKVEQASILKALFGAEGSRVISNINTVLEKDVERLAAITEKIRNGAGIAVRSGNELLQGLPGAVSLIEGTFGTLQNQVGAFLAGGFEPIVRAANTLLLSFLGLPAPVKQLTFAIAGFTTVLAGATAAIATYQALSIKQRAIDAATLALTKGKAAAEAAYAAAVNFSVFATQKNIGALTLNTLATVKNTLAQQAQALVGRAVAAAQTLIALATGKATAAQQAQAAATAASASGFLRLAATGGAAAGAIAAIAIAAATLRELTQFSREAESSVTRIREAFDRYGKAVQDAAGKAPILAENLDAVREKNLEIINEGISGLQRFLDFFRNALNQISAQNILSGIFDSLPEELRNALIAARGEISKIPLVGPIVDQVDAIAQQFGRIPLAAESAAADATIGFRKVLQGIDDNLGQVFAKGIDGRTTREELQALQEAIAAADQELLKTIPTEENDIKLKIAKQQQLKALRDEVARYLVALNETGAATVEAAEAESSASRAYQERISQLQQLEQSSVRDINQLVLTGAITQEEAEERKLNATKDRIQQQLEAELALLAELERNLDPEDTKAVDEIAKRRLDVLKLETELTDIELKKQERARKASIEREKKALRDLQNESEKANAAIALAESQRLADTQRLLNAGVITEQEANQRRLQSTRDRIAAELRAEQEGLKKLQALPEASTPEAKEEREKAIRAAIQKTADLQLRLLENERQQQEAVKEATIKAIRRAAAEQDRASQVAIAAITRQNQALQAQENRLNGIASLLQAQQRLQQAVANAQAVQNQGELDSISRAIAARQRLNSGELISLEERRRLQEQINQAGLGAAASERQLLDERIRLETDRYNQQFDALLLQQEVEAKLLQIEIQREELAARRAVNEARRAEIEAQREQQAARARLREAQVSGDQDAIAAARAEVALADQSAALAAENTRQSQEQLGLLDQIAATRLSTLQTEQETARQQLELTRNAELYASALERAAIATRSIQQNQSAGSAGIAGRRTGGEVQAGVPYRVGEAGAEIFVPSTPGYVLTAKTARAIASQQMALPNVVGSTASPDDALLKELRQVRRSLSKIQPVQRNEFKFVNEQAPDNRAIELQRQMLRQQMRGLGL